MTDVGIPFGLTRLAWFRYHWVFNGAMGCEMYTLSLRRILGILSSSTAEHPAVNRRVVGSNPT